jgi:hypothetical protein
VLFYCLVVDTVTTTATMAAAMSTAIATATLAATVDTPAFATTDKARALMQYV